jgi:aminoglycoside N3'-acetyltransferase
MDDRSPLNAELTIDAVTAQIRALGVQANGVLLVHSSFRAVRPIEDGPPGLIAALRAALGPDGTLVMPSWTEQDDVPFDPASTRAAADLGVVADQFWRLPGVLRSAHPLAFAAVGPRARRITGWPMPVPPYAVDSPVGRVFQFDGQVLLIGVGHEASTMIHFAEYIAAVPYRVPRFCTMLRGGRALRIDYMENDHCCRRFELVDRWLRQRGVLREGRVGDAQAKLVRARDLVETVRERLVRDPFIFLHPRAAGCRDCDEAWRSTGA